MSETRVEDALYLPLVVEEGELAIECRIYGCPEGLEEMLTTAIGACARMVVDKATAERKARERVQGDYDRVRQWK